MHALGVLRGSIHGKLTGGFTDTLPGASPTLSLPHSFFRKFWNNLFQNFLLLPNTDPLSLLVSPLQHSQFGPVKVLTDFPEAGVGLVVEQDGKRLREPQFFQGRKTVMARDEFPVVGPPADTREGPTTAFPLSCSWMRKFLVNLTRNSGLGL